MIAQVMTFKGQPGMTQSEEMRAFVQQALDEAVTRDGVEANVALTDPASGEALAITFFRDQSALDAFQEFSRQKQAESEERSGADVGLVSNRVYSEVMGSQAAPAS